MSETNNTINITNTIIFLIFFAGVIILQVFLSRRQNKWLGLILPAICLTISLIAVMGLTAYTTTSSVGTISKISENGKVINEIINTSSNKSNIDLGPAILQCVIVFIMCNIPTAILLAIYVACREKVRKNRQLEKMNLQDI